MIERDNIPFVHWQKKLVSANDDILAGNIVHDYDDIFQEIRIILMTQIGSVPTNPLKGCNLMSIIDLPALEATPLISQIIWDAVNAWVTRIEVGSVTTEAIEPYHWSVIIPVRVRDDVSADFTNYTYNLTATKGQIYAS